MKRFTDLEKKYVLDVIDNEFATSKNSIYNNKLEKQFAEMFDAKFAIGHCNGTATLHVALMAVGIQPGDEVIVPALTMSSTSIPVVLCGAIPVFADSDLDTFQISPESIEKCITSKTKAIISVSLFGLLLIMTRFVLSVRSIISHLLRIMQSVSLALIRVSSLVSLVIFQVTHSKLQNTLLPVRGGYSLPIVRNLQTKFVA